MAIADWDFPRFPASSSCVILSIFKIVWYVLASSIGVRLLLCKFSRSAILAASLSSISLTNAGIVSFPASWEALKRRSPAIISYLSPTFLTIIGCITPCCFIDSESSVNSLSLNISRGWNLFGIISCNDISNISFSKFI